MTLGPRLRTDIDQIAYEIDQSLNAGAKVSDHMREKMKGWWTRLDKISRETTPPEALRNQIIDECAKAINKRTEQLCSDPEVCYQESDTGATVINSRYSDHVEALDEAEAIVLALKTIPSPYGEDDGTHAHFQGACQYVAACRSG